MNLVHKPLTAENTEIILNTKTGKYELICLETGETISQDNLVADLSKYRFNMEQGLLVCQAIREGKTLQEIAKDSLYPSIHVISYWRKTNPMFDEEIKLARKQRAEYYHDRVLELANTLTDQDNVAVAKFKADQYRWAAEKGDPSSYGNKIEHTGSNVAPSIVVFTGINRQAKPDIIEVVHEQKDTNTTGQSDKVSDSGGVSVDSGVIETTATETEEQGQD